MSNQAEHPLAWSQTGDPIELPETASLWRVRRLNGGPKGGAPEMVYGPDGLPLTLDIGLGPLEFAEAVDDRPGKYRLDVLDDSRRPVPNVPPAYVVVQGKPSADATPGEGLARAFEVIERVTRTVAEAMDRQSSQMATLVEASARLLGMADRAGLTRRNEAPAPAVGSPTPHATPAVPPSPTVEPAAPEPSVLDRMDRWIEQAMPFIGPLLPQIGMALMRKLAPTMFTPLPAPGGTAAPQAPLASEPPPAVSEGGAA